MTKYIDVDAFTKVLKNHIEYLSGVYGNDCTVVKTLLTVISEMNAFPTADVQKAIHEYKSPEEKMKNIKQIILECDKVKLETIKKLIDSSY